MTVTVFISHSTRDDAIVTALRERLEPRGIKVWADSRELAAGDPLEASITAAIDRSTHLVAVLSQNAVNSPWVKKEIGHALQMGRGIKVIPLLIDPIGIGALGLWFGEAPVALKLEIGPGGIDAALPDLLAALGLQLPNDPQTAAAQPTRPMADLLLRLSDPGIEESDGKRRAAARAELIYRPADQSPQVTSRPYRFTAPLGAIEADDLRWYLERWSSWPSDHFRARAEAVEAALPEWGRRLYAALDQAAAREVMEGWRAVARHKDISRRFTVQVDAELMEGSSEQETAAANESATALLALPWELLHDQRAYLFQGAHGVRVRRQLPNRETKAPLLTDPPIRILLVSPRPEEEGVGYIDHRVSARPLVEALAPLGELVQLDVLTPPGFQAMTQRLQQALDQGRPYHVVHFDGHGVYDRRHGLGALCFEDGRDAEKPADRRSHTVDADAIAAALTDHRVPLFFLEACQSAKAERDPTASVAGRLLQRGVASVVAMSHSVLVETARRFVGAFYRELMAGRPVGEAMLAGQRELHDDRFRLKGFSGDLELHDWFVPVLFQEDADPQLIRALPAERVQSTTAEQRRLALGELPEPPPHAFVGRSRELLMAERLLQHHPYAVLRGEGGEGKTTAAVELARWLVANGRFARAVFASAERCDDSRKLLWAIGTQLVPNFEVEAGKEQARALQLVQRQLSDKPTLILIDNLETVLEPAPGSPDHALFEPERLEKIFQLCGRLGQAATTRLLFTSREPLPAPFNQEPITIGRLAPAEAIELVGRVLGEGRLMPHARDSGESDAEIERLVEAVGCHARALVLLAGEIADSGVRNATEQLDVLMARLHERFPDDRERSLLASVELSLRRLPRELRERLGPLGLFHGGGHIRAIALVLGLDTEKDEEVELARQLVRVGLAEQLSYGHLRLDPALAAALRTRMAGALDEAGRRALQQRWCEVMEQFTDFLYEQRFQDAQLAATLTLPELPNLLANLDLLQSQQADAERLVGLATRIEGLLQNLDRPRALARVVRIRSEAGQRLGAWGHARFIADAAAVDRLLEAGRLPEALTAARGLLERAQAAGEGAYAGAPYDLARASFKLGRVLRMAGHAAAALPAIEAARRGFQRLADGGGSSAARMASGSLTEKGSCLLYVGRLEEAAGAYEEAIQLAEARKDHRDVAVGKFQLGTVRLLQKNHPEALAAYEEARRIFTSLNEPASLATAWHQTGIVYEEMQRFDAAEAAYRQSLRIRVQRGDRAGEADSLLQLANLYSAMGRREEAVTLYRQAAEIYLVLQDLAKEGRARNNAADDLIQLHRHDEARTELLRTIECNAPYGHAAEPWKTFNILTRLEQANGDPEAAARARQRAIAAFLDYRRDGGENLTGRQTPQLTAGVARAIRENQTEAAARQLAERQQRPDLPGYLEPLIPALQRILAGSRDPALADDPELDYPEAAELKLLLEQL